MKRIWPLLCCALLTATAAGAVAQESPREAEMRVIRQAPPQALYWIDHARGWHFYEEPPAEPPPAEEVPLVPPAIVVAPPAPPAPAPQAPELPVAPEIAEFKELQKQAEDFRMIAIMRPTETNVRRYMALEKRIYDQASRFSDVTQRVAWMTPELDPTQQGRPVNQAALEVYDRQKLQERASMIGELSQTHVLMFFYRSDCPYCHAFAPILAQFEARYGLQVMPISVDGGALPQFSRYRTDNGISRTLEVTQVPAVFLAQPGSGNIIPLGVGVLSDEQLVQRISTVGAPGGTHLVPSAVRQISFQQ